MRAEGLFSQRVPWAWILALAAVWLYIPFIGGVSLFDWDEINFAEISREMIMTGDYLNIQVNYQPFFEKPPFFFWLQALCMKVYGVNEFAARLPNALLGIFVLVFLFKLGSRWVDRRFGVLWALSYMGSILPALYHKSGIIDPWFNLFIFTSIITWHTGVKHGNATKWFLLSGVLSAMAVLTKGPVGPLLVGFTISGMRLWSGQRAYLTLKAILLFILANLFVAGIWFGINWYVNGPDLIMAFIKYQAELLTKSVGGHKGFPGYHFVVTLIGVFPASIFALGAFRKKADDEAQDIFTLRQLMILLTAIVLVLFSIVQSKIVHYSSLAYYPVSFLSAWVISRHLDQLSAFRKWQKPVFVSVAFIMLIALLLLPIAGLNMDWIKTNMKFDAFTRGTLDAQVNWGWMDFIPALWFVGGLFIFYRLFKKQRVAAAFVSLFATIGLFVTIALVFFIGKIERYSQYAAVEFCRSVEGKEAEIKTIGFKTYLPYFYAKKPKPDPETGTERWKKFYILRANKRQKLKDYPELNILYEKNGFIFLDEK